MSIQNVIYHDHVIVNTVKDTLVSDSEVFVGNRDCDRVGNSNIPGA